MDDTDRRPLDDTASRPLDDATSRPLDDTASRLLDDTGRWPLGGGGSWSLGGTGRWPLGVPSPDGLGSRPLVGPRLSRRRLIALDVLAAAGFTALLLAFTVPRVPAAGALPAMAQCLLVACIGLPVAARRLWPVPVFCVVLAMTVVSLFIDMAHDSFAAAAFALYLVALTRPGLRWVPTRTIGAISAVVIVGSAVSGPIGWWMEGFPFPMVVFGTTLMGGAWTIGRAVRERRLYLDRSATEFARRAVAEERLRIARELHDVVAHSMTLITVKAGIADHVADVRPQEARKALREIEAVSRSALTEMRHLLGVLRSEGDQEAATDLYPAPGLARLPELAERAALAGVRVELDVREVESLPEGLELSAYRIVQEALTNVVMHAAPARCQVTVRGVGRELRVEVLDDGPGTRLLPGTAEPASGHGLVGMRERVTMYGGAFSAGPRPGGGFAVRARMPYEPTARRTGDPEPAAGPTGDPEAAARRARPEADARRTGDPERGAADGAVE
ncbi:sensor histidine kinase [Sphaerisporangium perillae]|uniref:sensor histidine kinase n=1 Tax=Sphaerisporangium perillae TaxID=2935860 RepID=UPI00200D7586|nr:sensor histidine kinase [Sphaerisporangium perillae]